MTIDEAIKHLTEWRDAGLTLLPAYDLEALKLGFEALKRIEQERGLHTYPAYKLLPGETK